MKRTHLTILAASVIAIIVVISCKKNGNYNNAGTPTLNQLFADLKTTPQNFTVTAGKYQTIMGSDSTVINFYPNSFKDKNGNVISSGTVNIQLIEMYKPGDMIANHTSATTGGQVIQSGGQINIVATMNAATVYANKYSIAFKQKSASMQRMELYYGGVSGTDSVTTWTVTDTTKNGTKGFCINKNDSTIKHTDTIRNYNYYPNIYCLFDSCTSFNWINCDHFYGDSTLTASITINFADNTSTALNTLIYIVYPAINSTQSFYGSYNSANTAIVNPSIRLPKGQNIDIVVIANKNGAYSYFQQTGIPTAANITVNDTPVNDTRGDVIARLEGL